MMSTTGRSIQDETDINRWICLYSSHTSCMTKFDHDIVQLKNSTIKD